jgi:hypothetical protein
MSRLRTRLAAAAAFLLLAVVPATVSAAPGGAVSITINAFATESFTTTGGILCASGTATSDFHKFAGGPVAGSFHLTKTLVCGDNPENTFTIRVDAATVFGSPTDQGGWSVAGGTGAYAGLSGGGNLVGTYVDDGIIDLYTGIVQL